MAWLQVYLSIFSLMLSAFSGGYASSSPLSAMIAASSHSIPFSEPPLLKNFKRYFFARGIFCFTPLPKYRLRITSPAFSIFPRSSDSILYANAALSLGSMRYFLYDIGIPS